MNPRMLNLRILMKLDQHLRFNMYPPPADPQAALKIAEVAILQAADGRGDEPLVVDGHEIASTADVTATVTAADVISDWHLGFFVDELTEGDDA